MVFKVLEKKRKKGSSFFYIRGEKELGIEKLESYMQKIPEIDRYRFVQEPYHGTSFLYVREKKKEKNPDYRGAMVQVRETLDKKNKNN